MKRAGKSPAFVWKIQNCFVHLQHDLNDKELWKQRKQLFLQVAEYQELVEWQGPTSGLSNLYLLNFRLNAKAIKMGKKLSIYETTTQQQRITIQTMEDVR